MIKRYRFRKHNSRMKRGFSKSSAFYYLKYMYYFFRYVYYRIKRITMSFLSALLSLCMMIVGLAFLVFLASSVLSDGDPSDYNDPVKYLNIAGADGHRIKLVNNVNATDPSYEELKRFLKADLTDTIPYEYGSFVCADFAETVHNNAEEQGIKAGYVSVDFYEITEGHACNVFNTTDEGLVFVDCTAPLNNDFRNHDTIVTMGIGEKYELEGLFEHYKVYMNFDDVDLTVKTYEIYW